MTSLRISREGDSRPRESGGRVGGRVAVGDARERRRVDERSGVFRSVGIPAPAKGQTDCGREEVSASDRCKNAIHRQGFQNRSGSRVLVADETPAASGRGRPLHREATPSTAPGRQTCGEWCPFNRGGLLRCFRKGIAGRAETVFPPLSGEVGAGREGVCARAKTRETPHGTSFTAPETDVGLRVVFGVVASAKPTFLSFGNVGNSSIIFSRGGENGVSGRARRGQCARLFVRDRNTGDDRIARRGGPGTRRATRRDHGSAWKHACPRSEQAWHPARSYSRDRCPRATPSCCSATQTPKAASGPPAGIPVHEVR